MPSGVLFDRPCNADQLGRSHAATSIVNGTLYCKNAGLFGPESVASDAQSSASMQFTLELVQEAANAGGSGNRPIAGISGHTASPSSTSANPSVPGTTLAVNGAASSPVFGYSSTSLGVAGRYVGGRRSVNMTECVPVPSSEHVAEIVGRQGIVQDIHM
jgi:hypothetical protein